MHRSFSSPRIRIVRSPERLPGRLRADDGPWIFLAGGATAWRSEFAATLEAALPTAPPTCAVLFDPIDPTPDLEARTRWEHDHIAQADVFVVWFPARSAASASLIELGRFIELRAPLYVGVDPDSPTREAVTLQLRLLQPTVRVVDTIDALANELATALAHWINSRAASPDGSAAR